MSHTMASYVTIYFQIFAEIRNTLFCFAPYSFAIQFRNECVQFEIKFEYFCSCVNIIVYLFEMKKMSWITKIINLDRYGKELFS